MRATPNGMAAPPPKGGGQVRRLRRRTRLTETTTPNGATFPPRMGESRIRRLRRRMALTAAAFVMMLVPGILGAEVMIEHVSWQWAQPTRRQKPAYRDVEQVGSSAPRIGGLLRARVALKNRGPKAADGILLRYAISAKLAPVGGGAQAQWAVPYMVDERRVPKIGPNQIIDVPLDPARSLNIPLKAYLQRVHRSGFWPLELRIQVMLSPHRGNVDEVRTRESVLRISP